MVALSAPQFPATSMVSIDVKALGAPGTWPDAAATLQALAAQAQLAQLAQLQEMHKVQMFQAQQRLAFAEALRWKAMVQEQSPKQSTNRKRAARLHTPPGLALPRKRSETPPPPPGLERAMAAIEAVDASAAGNIDASAADAVVFEGHETTRVSWRVSRFTQQLVCAMGRPLVSPCLEAEGLSDTWIMVEPCIGDVRGKEQKERFRKRVKTGPLDCRIKVKLAEAQHLQDLLCRVTIGSHTFPVFAHHFADEPLLVWQPPGFDWSKEVAADDSIQIGLEFATMERAV